MWVLRDRVFDIQDRLEVIRFLLADEYNYSPSLRRAATAVADDR